MYYIFEHCCSQIRSRIIRLVLGAATRGITRASAVRDQQIQPTCSTGAQNLFTNVIVRARDWGQIRNVDTG